MGNREFSWGRGLELSWSSVWVVAVQVGDPGGGVQVGDLRALSLQVLGEATRMSPRLGQHTLEKEKKAGPWQNSII